MQAGGGEGRCLQRDPPVQGCMGYLAALALLPTVAVVTFLVLELVR